MKLGIFSKTFVRSSLEETLDGVQANGLERIQFNMACAGMSSMPERADMGIASKVRRETLRRNIKICAVSGTYNMAHPDLQVRQEGLNRLEKLAAMCDAIGTSVITLCTGSRDPQNMWKWHPDNQTAQAWNDLIASMEKALEIAERYKVTLAIEPEASNVIFDAKRAKSLLELMQTNRLKIVMDAANLFHPGQLPDMKGIMDEAFELLGSDIVLAHAKDLSADESMAFVAAGQGVLDYDYYISLLKKYSFDGALIMHGLGEDQVPASVRFLRNKLEG